MTIFFNWLGVFQYAICFICGLLLDKLFLAIGFSAKNSELASGIITIIISLFVMIVWDILYRLSNVRRKGEKIYKVLFPNRGGHIMFVPSFIVGIYIFVTNTCYFIEKLTK